LCALYPELKTGTIVAVWLPDTYLFLTLDFNKSPPVIATPPVS